MQANADGMQFQLLLVGSGSQQHELKAYAEHSEGTIHVCSPVSHWHIPGWLSQAHIGVLPFPDEEKFRVSSPIKLFEYLAAGLPILATQIDCHTDVVGDGAYAFWAHTADQEGLHRALQQAWQERSLLATRGAQAAAAAPNWTWQATAARLRTALEYGMARCHND
jgi:glycosyltransferase involved in cell wall biosynthesis